MSTSAPPPAQIARLELVIAHPPLAYVYEAFTPSVTINGQKQARSWGLHVYDLAPGEYTISVAYPWLFMSECGKGTVSLSLGAGDLVKVTYMARYIRYVPGKMTVEHSGDNMRAC